MTTAAYLATIELIEKDDRSFKLKKVVGKNEYVFSFNMRGEGIRLYRNGNRLGATEASVDNFFRTQQADSSIIDLVSTDVTKELFVFAYKRLSKQGDERIRKLSRAFGRLNGRPWFCTLYFAGFSAEAMNSLLLASVEKEATKPHEILKVGKYLIPYIKMMDAISGDKLQVLRRFDERIGSNNLKRLLDTVREEREEYFFYRFGSALLELMEQHGYKDARQLFLYLVRDVKINQGITAAHVAYSLLRDYCRMSKTMGYPHFTHYSKNLKKDHDVTTMNYKVNEDKYKNESFKQVVAATDYVSLVHHSKDFSIINPDTVQSVIREGTSLGHCVASYVDDIIQGNCKILFLRETENIEDPLVTVEVRGASVRQVRGQHNRKPAANELAYVRRWAERKELAMDLY